jgi:hypothetical protein
MKHGQEDEYMYSEQYRIRTACFGIVLYVLFSGDIKHNVLCLGAVLN